MTQPTIAEPSSFSPFGEKINAVNARYRAPFRRPAESEVVAAPVMRFALTDAELLVGAVLFGTIGLMGLVELASGQALAFGLADRQITRTRRTVSGVIGAGSLAIASTASVVLLKRYGESIKKHFLVKSLTKKLMPLVGKDEAQRCARIIASCACSDVI